MSVAQLAAGSARRDTVCGIRVAPSILAADYARLGTHVADVLDAGATVIHCDVMDGHFVPPITFGPLIVAALSDIVHCAGAALDVHLMIERPERQISEFASAGADVITIHAEATPHVHHVLAAVRDAGCLAGLALNPGTDPSAVVSVSESVDLVLCMTVNPGWGGQRFIDSTLAKIAMLRRLLPAECALEVDGGVDPQTVTGCVQRGANLLVAGSAIFGQTDLGEAYRRLVDLATRAVETERLVG